MSDFIFFAVFAYSLLRRCKGRASRDDDSFFIYVCVDYPIIFVLFCPSQVLLVTEFLLLTFYIPDASGARMP